MRLPVVPTLMVAVMVPVMIALGFWQLQRAEWKAGLLADLAAAPAKPVVDLDAGPPAGDVNFRRATATCNVPNGRPVARAGQNRRGAAGYSFRLPCRDGVVVVAGWAPRPDVPASAAAVVSGTLVALPDGKVVLLYADRAEPPLEPAAAPSTDTISNNHTAYAVQWFAFAAVLSIIFVFYVRRRRA